MDRAWIGYSIGVTFTKLILYSRLFYRRHSDRFVLWRDNPSAYENRHVNESTTLETHLPAHGQEGTFCGGAN